MKSYAPLLGTGKVPYAKSEPMCTGTFFRFLTEPAEEGSVNRVISSAKDDAAATTFRIILALSAASAEDTTPSFSI